VGLIEKTIPGSVVGCAGITEKTIVSIGLLFYVFSELDDVQLTFGYFVISFWVPWANCF
jgi:hypothetical protein